MKGDFYMKAVGATPTIVLPANPHRRTLMLGCGGTGSSGSFSWTDNSKNSHASDTTTTGIKLTYTVSPGVVGFVPFYSARINVGTNPTLQLLVTTNGVTTVIQQNAGAIIQAAGIALSAGDTCQWNVSAAGASSNTDFFISAQEYSGTTAAGADIWVGFGQQPANGVGMPIFGGVSAREFAWEQYGHVIGLDIWAVAAAANTQLAILHGYD